MNILYAGIMLIGYLFNTCIPVITLEEHKYCNGIGIYTLYLCVDETNHFTEWINTCSSAIEGERVNLVFLPLMIKGE
jgi:hypothetical protein